MTGLTQQERDQLLAEEIERIRAAQLRGELIDRTSPADDFMASAWLRRPSTAYAVAFVSILTAIASISLALMISRDCSCSIKQRIATKAGSASLSRIILSPSADQRVAA